MNDDTANTSRAAQTTSEPRPDESGADDLSILLRRVDEQTLARPAKRRRQGQFRHSSDAHEARQHETLQEHQQQQQQPEAGPVAQENGSHGEAHQRMAFSVPTVSVSTVPSHDDGNDDADGSFKRRRKPKKPQPAPNQDEARPTQDENSTTGSASTTSDVNSLDGAESIASRLSQIVDEQEFLMSHAQAAVAGPTNSALAPTTRSKPQHVVSSSSLMPEAASSPTKLVSLHPTGGGGGLTPQATTGPPLAMAATAGIQNSALSFQKTSRRQEHEKERQLRQRTKSFGQSLGGPHELTTTGGGGKPAVKLAERRNESSGSLYMSGSTQFSVERGDLRELKRALALSQQQNSIDRAAAGQDQLMLNIRRSAWKLDEFEQAFKPPEVEIVEVASLAGVGEPAGAPLSGAEQEVGSGGEHPQDGRTAFERATMSRSSSTKNFFMRASRRLLLSKQRSGDELAASTGAAKSPILNNCLLLNSDGKRRFSHSDSLHQNWQQQHQQQQQQQQHQQLHVQSSVSTHKSHSNHLLSASSSGIKLDELEQRRASGISMVSFASSLDSTRTFASRRPFGRLGSMLGGGRRGSQRKRHRGGHRGCESMGGGGDQDHDSTGCQCTTAGLAQYVPVFEWLPAYNWRQDFMADLTAGLAVAVLNISTSLSAAVVAETELGVAFRSSIFNTFVYAILCSSRHSSFGSWSIMSQMLLDSVRRALGDELILSRIHLGPQAAWNAEEYETWHMNIIIMYTFLIGLVQLLAGVLNLGNILASFIPEALCSSMIAATAFTMAIGQLANMCGTSNKILWAIEKNTTELAWADLKQPVSITDLFSGLFRWIQQIALLLKHYEQINLVACLISAVTVILLFANQSFLQAKLRAWFKKDNLFIPFEMLLLIVWICFAYALELRDKYSVATCGPIFIEFNMPNVPNLRLVRELWLDSLATALISYTMVFIMAKTYSNKLNYEINANQELIACGAGNLIGGLFDALPATASFSRTAGQVEAGGRTQMASLVNCITLVVLAQYLGHHVSHLPVCVMSATLFFGFVRMATRAREALIYWRLCKVDFVIWFFTFGAIITFDLVNGFVYGFIFSLLTMLYRAQSRRCYMLGSIGQSDVYVPLPKYPLAQELDGIKIFQFCGPIHYVCADLFERLLRQKTRVDVKQLIKQLEQQQQQDHQHGERKPSSAHATHGYVGGDNLSISTANIMESGNVTGVDSKPAQFNPRDMNLPTHIILDFSMISNLDTAGIRIIKKIIVDYQRVNITIMLASLASHVAQMVKSDPSLWEAHKDRFYLTLADAVHHALRDNLRSASVATISKLG